MILTIARPINPPDLALRVLRDKRVEHCQHRCRTDASAEQNNRIVTRAQGEAAVRRADIQHVPDTDVAVHERASDAVLLQLHTNPEVIGSRQTRQRIATK
jgi:hypothetical protein